MIETRLPTWARQIDAALRALLRCPTCGKQGTFRGDDVFACPCGCAWRLVREETTT